MRILLLFGIVAVAVAGTTRFQGYVINLCLSKKITWAALIMWIMIMYFDAI